MFTRDYKWRSGGKFTKIKDMSDIRLINVIIYVKNCRNMDDPINVDLLKFLEHEALRVRKLTKQFINMGPFPFKKNDGNWAVCHKKRYQITQLSYKAEIDPNLEFDEDILDEDIFK